MRTPRSLLPSVLALLLVACASTPEPEPVAPVVDPPAAPVAAPAISPQVAAALAAPGRTAADRERDARDHPGELLTLAGFGPGMTIGDIFGGGGYYTEIISTLVGPTGRVRLVNNAPYDDYAKATLAERLAGGRLANVSYELVPPAQMELGENTLDGALIVMSYHDLYVADDKDGWPAIDASNFIDQVVAALKPGATLLIVDHQARPGSGRADTQSLHRIEDAFAIADFRAHGLELVRSTELLRSAADDHSANVFDPVIRGKTDRFVHVYRKVP